jgi:IS30 family transposase
MGRATNMRVYLCYPHSAWQRRTCENTNGLLREMLPKSTVLSARDQVALDSIAGLLNNRQRQAMNWSSPAQAFRDLTKWMSEKTRTAIH